MKLTQVKGNTWVAEGIELIPFYKVDDRRCVLLDSGLRQEREELEAALLEAGLTPAGVLCSHAHVDHCANNGYFQAKYGAKIALTFPEAGMCSTVLTLKCYFLMLPPGMVEEESSCMIHEPDLFIPPNDVPFTLCGVPFRILHTPGHSAAHICTITPDNVCYTADALLSAECLEAKLPYNLSQAMAIQSREKLRGLDCDAYIMAHRGVCRRGELGALIDANQALVHRRTEEIRKLVTRPMTASEIDEAACTFYQLLTHRPARSLRFERNVRFFVDYLVDQGLLEMTCRQGGTVYQPAPAENFR
ncbi:MAG: MBL fold metallo-hydrolase [Lawsonibacter sp.]|nr:MBL fold metallo-hydrolase [Lawsonibacter sp.]